MARSIDRFARTICGEPGIFFVRLSMGLVKDARRPVRRKTAVRNFTENFPPPAG
jgi:hypothetical protein